MKRKQSFSSLDFGDLTEIGGNSLPAAGMFFFDNIDDSSAAYSDRIMANMMVKIRFDILTICRQGEIDYVIDNNDPVKLQGGSLAYFRQDQIIEFHADPQVKLLLIAFPHEMTHGVPELDSAGTDYDSICYSPPKEIINGMIEIYNMIRTTAKSPCNFYRKELMLTLMRALLFYLANAVKEPESEPGYMNTAKKMSRAKGIYYDFIKLVKTNFREHRNVKFYADQLCITPGHLSRIVKEISEKSVGQWIRRYVLLEAKYLLKSTDWPIAEISEQLNFPNPSFFSKYFRQSEGLTPAGFREFGGLREID